jgi:heme exporter protein A
MMTPRTLEIKQLAFEREHRFLFDNINASLQAGECLQVEGPNGSGKSTLLRILAGFIYTERNTVLWNQNCITAQRNQYQEQLHYIGHQNGVRAALTVRENLQLYGALQQSPAAEKITVSLERVGLHKLQDRSASLLSAGQLRRLTLARLLLVNQPLWILDEPLTALDLAGKQLFAEMLQEHKSAGGIAVIAAHHNLADTAHVLRLGAAHA